jgi:phage tail sheath protein FI
MPQYLSPGVYVEEVQSSNKPIQSVGTSTGAFVGLAEKGRIGVPIFVDSRSRFHEEFGGFVSGAFLAYTVDLFFQNGGTRCYVVRTSAHTGTTPTAVPASANLTSGGVTALRVSAASPGTWGRSISVEVVHGAGADAFSLRVNYRGDPVESFDGLQIGPAAASLAEQIVNERSTLIRVVANPDALVTLPSRPAAGSTSLQGGDNGMSGVLAGDFTGTAGLSAFDAVDDINIVSIPETSERAVVASALSYCEGRADCFFVAHADETTENAPAALAYKQASGSEYAGQAAFNSSYGALYVPWLVIGDPLTGTEIEVPPDGAVIGRYAATDIKRGVHKAAAGLEDGRLRGVARLDANMSRAEIEVLNPNSVNVLRHIDGVGDVIWGARTLSADPALRYVTTRRLLLAIEESIDEGTRWVVFEPNTPALWRSIERNVGAYLRTVWRNGALFGSTEKEAFFVRCNAETNPPESIALGRVVTEIGVAIVKPAEFVIFRISQEVQAS